MLCTKLLLLQEPFMNFGLWMLQLLQRSVKVNFNLFQNLQFKMSCCISYSSDLVKLLQWKWDHAFEPDNWSKGIAPDYGFKGRVQHHTSAWTVLNRGRGAGHSPSRQEVEQQALNHVLEISEIQNMACHCLFLHKLLMVLPEMAMKWLYKSAEGIRSCKWDLS